MKLTKEQAANKRLFDEALAHIRKQGKPSVDTNGNCVYRSSEGLGCAFAPAIADYVIAMDDGAANCANTILEKYRDHMHEWARYCAADFTLDIQNCHDTWHRSSGDKFVRGFESSMERLAEEFDYIEYA